MGLVLCGVRTGRTHDNWERANFAYRCLSIEGLKKGELFAFYLDAADDALAAVEADMEGVV